MVKGKDDKAVMYVNSETELGSTRIVKGVYRLMYIRVTIRDDGH
jgi:hypothetical protein